MANEERSPQHPTKVLIGSMAGNQLEFLEFKKCKVLLTLRLYFKRATDFSIVIFDNKNIKPDFSLSTLFKLV